MDGDGDGVVGFSHRRAANISPRRACSTRSGRPLRTCRSRRPRPPGVPVTFSVAPVDRIDPTPSVSWSFGDASTASGDTVTHTFADPGTYSVSVTATVAPGDSATHTGTIAVVAPVLPAVPAFHAAMLDCVDRHRRQPRAGASVGRLPRRRSGVRGDGDLDAARHREWLGGRSPCAGTPVTVAAGDASFGAAAGTSTTVSIALPTAVLQLLKRHHHLTLTVALESHNASGRARPPAARCSSRRT